MLKNLYSKFPSRLLIAFMALLLSCGAVMAQSVKIKFTDAPLSKVLEEVTKQTGYRFVYSNALNAVNQKVTVNYSSQGQPIEKLFNLLFNDRGIVYKIDKNQVTLAPVEIAPKEILPAKPVTQNREGGANQQQVFKVSGKIVDDTSQPIAGAIIVNLTTGKGDFSNGNGEYSILAKEGDKLKVTFIGMVTEEFVASQNRQVYDITMRVEQTVLGEVLVTGYQTISKERAGGAYSIIDQKLLSKKPVDNISHALKGMVAGMAPQTTSLDGEQRFIIRGTGTMQTSQDDKDPLIVVDGFPIQGYSGSSISNAKDPFLSINPNDVESITVLKDAAATSIYGSRAANGVIVITTKKGKASEKININFSARTSVASKPDLDYAFNMASTESMFWIQEHNRKYDPTYIQTYNDPYYSATNPFIYINEPANLLLQYLDRKTISEQEFLAQKAQLIANEKAGYWKKDLYDLVYTNALEQQYDLSLRGGSNKMTYTFSSSYFNQQGYSKGNDNNRINLNYQNSYKISPKLTFELGANASIVKNIRNGVEVSSLPIGPYTRFRDDSGNFIHTPNTGVMYYPILMDKYESKLPVSWQYNPIVDRDYNDSRGEKFGVRLNSSLNYRVCKELSIALSGQYENNRYSSRREYAPESYFVRNYVNTYSQFNSATGRYVTDFPAGGIFTTSGDTYNGYNLRGQVNFNKEFGKHSIVAIAGSEITSSTTESDPSITRYGYNKNTNAVLSTVDYITQRPNIFGINSRLPFSGLGGISTREDRYFSAYANLAYTYNGKYTLNASIRTDAANFQAQAARDKFSPFWSLSGVWLASGEEFIKNLSWVNYLKVRASIGEAGIAAGKQGASAITTLGVNAGSLVYTNNEPYNTVSQRGNPTLTWEKARNYDFGVDFALFGNKMSGSINYYNKYSYDVLSAASVPIIHQGVSSSTFNNAAISNKGVEITLGSELNITKDFRWNGNLTLSYNKNRLEKYYVVNTSIQPAYHVGFPLRPVWAFDVIGYSPEGYLIQKGRDGTELVVKSRADTHIYDILNTAAGESIHTYNWTHYLGNSTPSTHLGFRNMFSYKGLSLSFMITGQFDYYIGNSKTYGESVGSFNYSKHLEGAIEMFKEGYANQKKYVYHPILNDDNKAVFNAGYTRMYSGNLGIYSKTNKSRGDFLRLEDINLSYRLPAKLFKEGSLFSGVEVYGEARNLGVVWSAVKEFDPQYPRGSFKPMRTFNFGIKLNLNK